MSEKDNKFKEEFKKSEAKFNEELKRFDSMYKDYISSSNKVIGKITELDNGKIISLTIRTIKKFEDVYSNFKEKLKTKYNNYLDASERAKRDSYPNNQTVEKYYGELQRYFKYQKYEKAQNDYKKSKGIG